MSSEQPAREHVSTTSADIYAERIQQLRAVVPEAFVEGKLDLEKLREALGESTSERSERYTFSWAGKGAAQRLIQKPSQATLHPAPDESVNWDTTQNVFIEGDNLEVLKLIYRAYYGRVKLIYIDPPYNTGSDFVYPDNYSDSLDSYLKLTGQKNDNGDLLTSNPQSSGRYHSRWLSMMYPRLFVARQLLKDDGVILVSIDDHEAYNLRALMNEVFGEENFIAQLVWEKGRKNDAKLFSVGHEYMLVYARSLSVLREDKTIWREAKPGAQEIWNEYVRLRSEHDTDDQAIEAALQEWYRLLPNAHLAKALSRYKHIDKFGPWRDRDMSWPGGGGPRYDVKHPKTKKPCKVPERGWGISSPESMERMIKLGLIVFREDHTEPPFRKAHLRPVPDELDEEEDLYLNGEDEEGIGMQVMSSYIYKQSQVSVKYLRNLLEEKVFETPKDHEVLARLIRYISEPDSGDIILDFFSGSASTAEAVLQLNRQQKRSNRRFVLVQFPEQTPAKSAARKVGYATIADIGKERIRRVIKKLEQERSGQLDLDEREQPEDLGFRVYKLAPSNFKQWPGHVGDDAEEYVQMAVAFADQLIAGWTREDLLWEVAIKEGISPSSRIETLPTTGTNTVLRITDPDTGRSFLICLDDQIDPGLQDTLTPSPDTLFICRDAAIDESTHANLSLACRVKTL
jgi:adenine-specific DNA-methyltransferase